MTKGKWQPYLYRVSALQVSPPTHPPTHPTLTHSTSFKPSLSPPTHPPTSQYKAFWPSLQVLAGEISAAKTSYRSFYALWKQYRALPEVYDARQHSLLNVRPPTHPPTHLPTHLFVCSLR